mgnify:CR=1 FL=1
MEILQQKMRKYDWEMKNKKFRKKILLIILVIVLLNVNFLISQSTNQETLDYYLRSEANLQEFIENTDYQTRKKVWEEAGINIKNSAIEDVANHFTRRRFDGDMLANGLFATGDAIHNLVLDELRNVGLDSITVNAYGVDLKIAIDYNGGLSGFLKDKFNVNIDENLVNTKILKFTGFDNKNLKWSELKDKNEKPRNIIGDGKVWLDLEKIPLGTKEVEYADGKFSLKLYNGGKIIISNTDEEGNVVLKETGQKNSEGKNEFITISPMDILLITESGNGEVELTEDGFILKNDAVVNVKGLQVKNREGINRGEFFIFNDRFVLKGTTLDLKGIAYINPKDNNPFIVPVGDTRRFLDFLNVELPKTMSLRELKEGVANFKDVGEILAGKVDLQFINGKLTGIRINEGKGKGEWKALSEIDVNSLESSDFLKNTIKEAQSGQAITYNSIQNRINNLNKAALTSFSEKNFKGFDLTELGFLAKEVSFEDQNLQEGVGFERKSVQFDENGQLIAVRNQKINREWASVKEGQDISVGVLKDLHDRSSPPIKELIKKAVKGERVTYEDLDKIFYSTSYLNEGGRTLKIDSRHENFAAFIGGDVVVGGKGNVELKKSMDSLTGFEANDFDVKIGDVNIRFDKNGIKIPREVSFANSYEIGDISYVKDGKLGAKSFTLLKEGNRYKIDDSKRMVAGRHVVLGPFRSSASVYSTIKSDDYAKIIQSENREELIGKTMQSEFEIGVDIHVPIEVIGYKIDDVVTQWLDKNFFNRPLENDDLVKLLGVKKFKVGTIDSIKSIIYKSIDSVGGGKTSIGFKNNPTGNPEIIIDINGKKKNIQLQGNDAIFMRDFLQLVIRIPDSKKGKTTSPFWGAETSYSGPSYMKRLWIDTFGDKIPLLGTGDSQRRATRIVPGEGFLNKFNRLYLEDANK